MAKSIIIIAFFLTTPNSMMSPTNANRSISLPKIFSVNSAPNTAEGRPERIVIGWMKLSYRIPKDDIDHENRHNQKHSQVLKRLLEFLHGALKVRADCRRHTALPDDMVDLVGSLAQREARALG